MCLPKNQNAGYLNAGFFLTTMEVKSGSHLVLKRFDKLSLETKKQSKMLNFYQKIVTLLVILL